MRRGEARIGCSGWQYADWRGRFYPEGIPKRAWFDHYASIFDTVELNSTFYRLPAPATADRWRDAAPTGFVYALKLGAFGTHRMKLRDAARWLPNHLDRVARLGDHAGPTLVQMPPRWHRDVDRLEEFLTVAPADRRWAVELRDASWLHDDVFAVLERHRCGLCIHDLLPRHPWLRTTDFTYVRFHGPRAREERYRGRYGPRRLARVAGRLGPWLDDGVDVYAYFNNDRDADAPTDALTLRRLLARVPTSAGR
jgi:uncharacterized protein YecE (DUF72 family)